MKSYYLIFVSLVVLIGCEEPTSIRNKGLVYCSEASPETFNPQLSSTGATLDATSTQLYNRLVSVHTVTQQLVGGLASHWNVSKDGKHYVFHLRKGVKFHTTPYFTPTRDMNANDVVFSFSRLFDPAHPYHKVSGGRYPFFENVQLSSLIKEIKKVGNYEVEFVLSRRDASFLANLATDFAVVLSAEYARQLQASEKPEQLDHQPIGTGPFKLKDYSKDNYIRYERHWGYWQGGAPMEQIVFDITPSPSNRLSKLLTKECDVMSYPAASQVEVISDNPELLVNVQTGLNVAFWAFNTKRPPLNNSKVRQALSMAVDRKTILQAVYYNTGVIANSILPPVSWAYNPNVTDYEYNPDKARELLEQAGVKDLHISIWAPRGARLYNPNSFKTAELIQADLAAVGVGSSILTMNWQTMRTKIAMGQHDTVLLGWLADTNDPDNFFRPQLGCTSIQVGSNASLWCDQNTEVLLSKAITTPRMVPRIRAYYELQELLREEMPLLPLAHSLRLQAHRKDVGGLSSTPFSGVNFANAYRK